MAHAALLASRILIGVLFVGGAFQKGLAPELVQGAIVALGLPDTLIWPLALINMTIGLMFWFGIYVRKVAVFAAAYCIATSIFHLMPSDPWQMSIFVKNWSIAGGCLALAVVGSGRFAVRPDGLLKG